LKLFPSTVMNGSTPSTGLSLMIVSITPRWSMSCESFALSVNVNGIDFDSFP